MRKAPGKRTYPALMKQSATLIATFSSQRSTGTTLQGPFNQSRLKFYQTLYKKPWGKFAQQAIKCFNAQEKKIVKEYYDLTILKKISPDFKNEQKQYEALSASQFTLYENSIKIDDIVNSPSQKIPYADRIQMHLKNCSIDPNMVHLLYKDQPFLGMGVGQTLFYIGPKALIGVKDAWVDPIIVHEIQHMLHNDAFLHRHLLSIYTLQSDAEKVKKFLAIKKLNHLHEYRADTLASLTDLKLAQNYADCLKNGFTTLEKIPRTQMKDDSLSHPSLQERYDNVAQVIKIMKKTNK